MIERVKNHSLEKYITPNVKHGLEGKSAGRKVVQTTKNLSQITLGKINRVIGLLTSGKWMNNKNISIKVKQSSDDLVDSIRTFKDFKDKELSLPASEVVGLKTKINTFLKLLNKMDVDNNLKAIGNERKDFIAELTQEIQELDDFLPEAQTEDVLIAHEQYKEKMLEAFEILNPAKESNKGKVEKLIHFTRSDIESMTAEEKQNKIIELNSASKEFRNTEGFKAAEKKSHLVKKEALKESKSEKSKAQKSMKKEVSLKEKEFKKAGYVRGEGFKNADTIHSMVKEARIEIKAILMQKGLTKEEVSAKVDELVPVMQEGDVKVLSGTYLEVKRELLNNAIEEALKFTR